MKIGLTVQKCFAARKLGQSGGKLGRLGRNVSHDREIIKLLVKNEICFRRQIKTEGACECRISGTHVHPLFYHLFCAVFCASEVPLELLI